MNSRAILSFVLLSTLAAVPSFGGQVVVSERYNHELHDAKVFTPQGISCSKCHNFSVDPTTHKAVPGPSFKESSLKVPVRQICHECHQGAEARNSAAPKACTTCHSTEKSINAIKPRNHDNVGWKKSHGTEARVAGDSCLNCHVTSQCVKCHMRRTDVVFENHSRNFRFTHSVEARVQPHRCDTCHTKSFCVSCHLGKTQ